MKFTTGTHIIKIDFSEEETEKCQFMKGARIMEKEKDRMLLCFACKYRYQDDNSEPCVSCRENGFKKFEKCEAEKDDSN